MYSPPLYRNGDIRVAIDAMLYGDPAGPKPPDRPFPPFQEPVFITRDAGKKTGQTAFKGCECTINPLPFGKLRYGGRIMVSLLLWIPYAALAGVILYFFVYKRSKFKNRAGAGAFFFENDCLVLNTGVRQSDKPCPAVFICG